MEQSSEITAGINERMDLLTQAGEILLMNGAATYRVEETMRILGETLGLPSVQIFVTPTGFTLQAAGPTHTVTQVRRITQIGVNMNRLEAVNRLSREAAEHELTVPQIKKRLSAIASQPSVYPMWLVVVGVSLACGAFAVLLGGGWREFLATVIGALFGMLTRTWIRRAQLLPLMVTVIAAFVSTVGSWGACKGLACTSPDVAPIAAVLQLVPGVPLVTTVIDLATGDILSGLVRGAYAIVIAAGIALGMLLFLAWGIR